VTNRLFEDSLGAQECPGIFDVVNPRGIPLLGFQHNLSAFLAALLSCTEHLRLFCKDPRFPAWYQEANAKYFMQPELRDLREFRRKEIHMQGTDTWQDIFVPFPENFGAGG
jgi:hypothetical protein